MVTRTSLKQAWKTDEDWTSIASKEERKKIQNRLNQRAHRKKNGQKENKSKKGGFHVERFRIVEISAPVTGNGSRRNEEVVEPLAVDLMNETIPGLVESSVNAGTQDDVLMIGSSDVEAPLDVLNCETSLVPGSWTASSLSNSLGRDLVSSLASIDTPPFSDSLRSSNDLQVTPFASIPPLADLVDRENKSHMAVMQAMFVATNLACSNQSTTSHAYAPNGTHSSFTYFPLSSDHLLHLIHHNVFRALTTNKSILSKFTTAIKLDSSVLRLSTKTICDGVSVVLGNEGQHMPPALYPTQAQRTISHPSYVNMFPFPRFRDNLIRYQDSFNPYELCNDLFGEIVRENGDIAFGSVPMGPVSDVDETADDSDGFTFRRRGMIVWGESWDPEGWEITPGFLRKWSWLLDGCESLIASSNRWRAERGEDPIVQLALAPLSRVTYV